MDRLDAMQTFVRVAEAGSFSAVANQLQVARSAITRQVAALEAHLGTTLIIRSTRRLTLTAAGAAYLEKARVILNMVDAAESGLAQTHSEPRGRIRLGLPLSFGLNELMPVLLAFANAHPDIELIMDLSDQRANLIEEGLDLSIRITADLQPGDIVRKLGECRLITLASNSYLKAHGTPKHPNDLRHHACLIYANAGTTSTWTYRDKKQPLAIAVRGRIIANNGTALLEAATLGMGITRQPDFLAAPYLSAHRLTKVLGAFEDTPLGIYAAFPSNRYIPHRVSVLVNHLAAALKAPTATERARRSPRKAA